MLAIGSTYQLTLAVGDTRMLGLHVPVHLYYWCGADIWYVQQVPPMPTFFLKSIPITSTWHCRGDATEICAGLI